MLTKEEIDRLFPKESGQIEIASDADDGYNCISWSLNDKSRPWWPFSPPSPFIYWPPDVPREETIEAFTRMYERLLFTKCSEESREEGYDKVALYALDESSTHAARLWIEDLTWSSKLGDENDIIHHTLSALEGNEYGEVVQIFKRLRRVPSR
jgi:hypothetical protein